LDITVTGSNGQERLTQEQELSQAIRYAQMFMIFREHSDYIDRVTLWGLDDATSWRSERFPLLFNRDLSPKLSYYAVIDPEGFLRERGLIP
jgi:endo-1,4-beta-xylanase